MRITKPRRTDLVRFYCRFLLCLVFCLLCTSSLLLGVDTLRSHGGTLMVYLVLSNRIPELSAPTSHAAFLLCNMTLLLLSPS